MSRRSFDGAKLARLREIPLQLAIDWLGLYMAKDRDFKPVENVHTERWIVSVDVGVCELLVTGSKWFDSAAQKGGGGAVDLVMHLLELDFVAAVKRLSEVAVVNGGVPRGNLMP